MTGRIINNRYRITEKLGEGGSGEVYKAFHIHLKTPWALKFVSSLDMNTQWELDILKNINHPAFPRLVDVISENKENIFVFDYYDGPNLLELITEKGRIEESIAIDWALQITDALLYLHTCISEPIIYRDLKPSNIIVLHDNIIKIIDFGTARLYKKESTNDTVYLGTPGYAAPEQYGFGQTDIRTDIYNFGMTMFHVVTGEHPSFCSDSEMQDTLKRSGVSDEFSSIILKCSAKDPEQRYLNFYEIKNELQSISNKPMQKFKAIGKNAVEISVSGTQSGAGVTHLCFLFGMWLQNSGFKTAVLDCCGNSDFQCLCDLVTKKNQVLKTGYFQIRGLTIFPSMGAEKAESFNRADYDYILLDHGVLDEYVIPDMKRSDVRLIVSPGADWKINRIGTIIKKYQSILEDKNTWLSFPFQNQESINIIKTYYNLSNTIIVPYAINPWKPDNETKKQMENIYEKLFDIRKKKRWRII
jgi:serine/threonine protein kinase